MAEQYKPSTGRKLLFMGFLRVPTLSLVQYEKCNDTERKENLIVLNINLCIAKEPHNAFLHGNCISWVVKGISAVIRNSVSQSNNTIRVSQSMVYACQKCHPLSQCSELRCLIKTTCSILERLLSLPVVLETSFLVTISYFLNQ